MGTAARPAPLLTAASVPSTLGQVGRQLAIIGDDINRRYDTEFQHLLEQLQPTADNAYDLFIKIASRYPPDRAGPPFLLSRTTPCAPRCLPLTPVRAASGRLSLGPRPSSSVPKRCEDLTAEIRGEHVPASRWDLPRDAGMASGHSQLASGRRSGQRASPWFPALLCRPMLARPCWPLRAKRWDALHTPRQRLHLSGIGRVRDRQGPGRFAGGGEGRSR